VKIEFKEHYFVSDWQKHGLETAWWNLRWRVGYKIGGFTSAKRASR
jgi:hypothetical protein